MGPPSRAWVATPLGIPRHAVDFGAAIRSHDVALEILHPIVLAFLIGGHVFECVGLTRKDGAVFDTIFNIGPFENLIQDLDSLFGIDKGLGLGLLKDLGNHGG